MELTPSLQIVLDKASCEKQWTVSCYILGKQLKCPGFKNACIDLLITNFKISHNLFNSIAGLNPFAIELVFNNTESACALQRLVADNAIYLYAYYPKSSIDEDMREDYRREFMLQMANAGVRLARSGFPVTASWNKPRTVYHE